MPPERSGSHARVYLAMFATILIWSLNYIFAKAALAYMDSMAFNALRYTVAATIVLTWWRTKETPQPLDKRHLLSMLAVGLWGYGVYQILFIQGLHYTTAGNSALFGSTAPLWTAVIGLLLGRERLAGLSWFGIVLAFVGVSLVIIGGQANISINPGQTLGDLLSLFAALVWASFTIFSKVPLARHSYTQFVAFGVTAGAVLLMMAGAPTLAAVRWDLIPWWVFLVIIFSGALSNALAYLVWANAVAKVGAARTAIFLNLTPVITLSLGVLALHEPIAWVQIVGTAGVLLGVWLTTRS